MLNDEDASLGQSVYFKYNFTIFQLHIHETVHCAHENWQSVCKDYDQQMLSLSLSLFSRGGKKQRERAVKEESRFISSREQSCGVMKNTMHLEGGFK